MRDAAVQPLRRHTLQQLERYAGTDCSVVPLHPEVMELPIEVLRLEPDQPLSPPPA